MDTCFLCHRNGSEDPLDNHHIFGGSNRAQSEALGLKVKLCHNRCHIFAPTAVHQNAAVMEKLHKAGQMWAMDKMGWDCEDFKLHFGKNYLDENYTLDIPVFSDFTLDEPPLDFPTDWVC